MGPKLASEILAEQQLEQRLQTLLESHVQRVLGALRPVPLGESYYVLSTQDGEQKIDALRQLVIVNHSGQTLFLGLSDDPVDHYRWMVTAGQTYTTPRALIDHLVWHFNAAPARPYAMLYGYSEAIFNPG